MGRGKTSLWLEATGIGIIMTVALSIISLSIKDNPYVIFPVLGISATTSLLFSLLRREIRNRGSEILRDPTWKIGIAIIVLSLLDSIAMWLIRFSTSLEEAMLFNGFQIVFTSSLLTALLAFTLTRPRYMIEKERAQTTLVIIFLFFSLFFSAVYFTNVLMGNFSRDVPKIGGIYFELDLSQAGFGLIYPLVKTFFTAITLLIVLCGTLQYIQIKNRAMKKYYSVLYLGILAVVVFEVLIVTILTYILKIKSITFFGLVSFIFSFVLVYYMIHIQETLTEIRKLSSGKVEGEGEMLIFTKDEEKEAKEFLRKVLERGGSALIFSTEDEDAFLKSLERYRNNITFVRVMPDGYRVGHSIFRSISELESMEVFSSALGGVVIYSNTLETSKDLPCEKRAELLRYYRFLLRALRRGGTLVAPINEEYLLKKGVRRSRNPLWLIRPLIILRLEEGINLVYSKIEGNRKERFIKVLKSLEKEGMPKITLSKDRICLDMLNNMDRERFSLLINRMGDMLEEKKIMEKRRYKEILRDFFEEYGGESFLTLMVLPGELNFVPPSNARERAIRMAISLSEEREKGLIISRVNPHILMRKYHIPEGFVLRWLTTTESRYTLYPHLEEIKREIFSFLDVSPDGIIVLDGAEYLQRMHGFDALLSLFWILQDRVSTTKAIVLIPINPDVLEKKDMESLKRDFHILE